MLFCFSSKRAFNSFDGGKNKKWLVQCKTPDFRSVPDVMQPKDKVEMNGLGGSTGRKTWENKICRHCRASCVFSWEREREIIRATDHSAGSFIFIEDFPSYQTKIDPKRDGWLFIVQVSHSLGLSPMAKDDDGRPR